jgi:membrane protein YqaA with SNARE-associated domain
MNFYSQVFLEALHTAAIVPMGHEPTLYAMQAFGTYDMKAPFVLAFIGAVLGHVFNWYVGRSLLFFEAKGKFRLGPQRYERARAKFEKYGVFALLLCWVPLFNLFVAAAGFFKLPLKKIMPFIVLGLALHYGLELV